MKQPPGLSGSGTDGSQVNKALSAGTNSAPIHSLSLPIQCERRGLNEKSLPGLPSPAFATGRAWPGASSDEGHNIEIQPP
jgi:hypothetical protein